MIIHIFKNVSDKAEESEARQISKVWPKYIIFRKEILCQTKGGPIEKKIYLSV